MKILRFTHDHNNLNTISHDNITALCTDNSGIIWVGTENGLNKLTPRDKDSDEYSIERILHSQVNLNSLSHNSVFSLMLDASSNLWVGTKDGLSLLTKDQIDSNQFLFRHFKSERDNIYSISDNTVRVIYQDSNESIWIGTDKGLNKLIKNGGDKIIRFKKFLNIPSDNSSISHNEIYSICEDNTRKLWVGTNGGGLNLFDTDNETFKRYLHSCLCFLVTVVHLF